MTDWSDSSEAIGAVDAVLAGAGLEHGRRSTRGGSWKRGERVRLPKSSTPLEIAVAGRRAPGMVTIAEWEQFPWLQAGFSTRQGGRSTAYSCGEVAEQNLGWTAEDDAATVAENRRRFIGAVGGKSKPELVTVRQFHSGVLRLVERSAGPLATPGLTTPEGRAVLRGDGLMTRERGLLLGIQTADCVPVLIADTRTRAVAAFHAGWRGTLARIVERGVGTMQREFGSRPKDLVAAIGPAIGACCFAVGEEVQFEFGSQFAYAPELFSEVYDPDPVREKYPLLFLTARAPGHSNLGPQIHLDLWEANRRQLLDAGLKAKAISVVGECTACARLKNGRRKYFSHRAEHGYTGRMLSVIGTANR
jgi:YfiH family protein